MEKQTKKKWSYSLEGKYLEDKKIKKADCKVD